MIDFSILTKYSDFYMKGLGNVIEACLIAMAGSFVLGTIIAVFRIAPMRWLNAIGALYVEVIRNIPLLMVVYGFYLLPPVFGMSAVDGFKSGTLGLIVYTASYIAEAVRAGILAVPKGQTEAARASGLTYIQTMRYIVLPQAIRIVIPPIGNQFLNIVKNSAILGVIAGFDLMYYADKISSDTFQYFSPYLFVALLYLVLTIPISFGVKYLERKFSKAR
ncbi:glutamine ABC transporter permease [Gordoniibacillus kamchatkensis]|uniref:Glutamine ABC transporter permease n=1 Tax=Gordoniibacillus kamchatkensis TaxID=1590651 RepID=A0ABR5AI91_9BACL|nr:amino acid ABC transporter permease [Paenibacillus sp. VKM B-2647]KIL40770.1 glutamine ABC transporter permease [Paenibacillus sp. VKM B-2647]